MPKQRMSLEEQIAKSAGKLTVADRELQKSQIEEMESRLEKRGDDDTFERGPQDPRELAERLKKQKARLDYDDELEARGHEKDRLSTEKKKLEERLRDGICTHEEMWVKDPSAHQRAVSKNLRWQEKNDAHVKRLQEINMRLDPDNPSAQSIEYLRPDR